MPNFKTDRTGPRIRGVCRYDPDFSLVATPVLNTVNAGASSEPVQDKDVVSTVYPDTTVNHEYQISVSHQGTGPAPVIALKNPEPPVASYDPVTGRLSWLRDGTVIVEATDDLRTRQLTLELSQQLVASGYEVVNSIVPTSLLYECRQQVYNRISGITDPVAAIELFSTWNVPDHVTFANLGDADSLQGKVIRNPNLWTLRGETPINLDCVAVAYSRNGTGKTDGWQWWTAGTRPCMITRKHGVGTGHYFDQGGIPGCKLLFITADNQPVIRTVVKTKKWDGWQQTYSGGIGWDLSLVELDEELPETITLPKMFPADCDFTKYFSKSPYFFSTSRSLTPVIRYSQARKAALLCENLGGGYSSGTFPDGDVAAPFWYTWWAGDSGNPTFVLINDQLVINSIFSSTWNTVRHAEHMTMILNQIAAWGSELTPSYVDLTGFDVYE